MDAASGIGTLSQWPSGAQVDREQVADSLRAGANAPAR